MEKSHLQRDSAKSQEEGESLCEEVRIQKSHLFVSQVSDHIKREFKREKQTSLRGTRIRFGFFSIAKDDLSIGNILGDGRLTELSGFLEGVEFLVLLDAVQLGEVGRAAERQLGCRFSDRRRRIRITRTLFSDGHRFSVTKHDLSLVIRRRGGFLAPR